MLRKTTLGMSLVVATLLTGCMQTGGEYQGDDTGYIETAATATKTEVDKRSAYFIDAPVQNVWYHSWCQAQPEYDVTGYTDEEGKFQFFKGAGCNNRTEFKLGSISLGTIIGVNNDRRMYLTDLARVGRYDISNPDVLKLGRFLQSLDEDGDRDNGIQIADATLQTFGAEPATDFVVAGDLNALVTGAGKVVLAQNSSQEHIRTYICKDIPDAPICTDIQTTAFNVVEDNTVVGNVDAVDAEGDTLTYSMSGTDAAFFTITQRGDIAFKTAPNFEDPQDNGNNNVYDLTVKIDDGNGHTDEEAVTVTVLDDGNNAPVIGISATVGVGSGATSVGNASVTDNENDPITYTLTGVDASLFSIDTNGNIVLNTAADYDNPIDQNADNSYEITIHASDREYETTKDVTVRANAYETCDSWIVLAGMKNCDDCYTDVDVSSYNGGQGLLFYGGFVTEIEVDTNGKVNMQNVNSDECSNDPLAEKDYAIVAPLWDDWNPENNPNNEIKVCKKADRVVVDWHDVPHISNLSSVETGNFQAVIYANGNISFYYGEITGADGSATVGITKGDRIHYINKGQTTASEVVTDYSYHLPIHIPYQEQLDQLP